MEGREQLGIVVGFEYINDGLDDLWVVSCQVNTVQQRRGTDVIITHRRRSRNGRGKRSWVPDRRKINESKRWSRYWRVLRSTDGNGFKYVGYAPARGERSASRPVRVMDGINGGRMAVKLHQ